MKRLLTIFGCTVLLSFAGCGPNEKELALAKAQAETAKAQAESAKEIAALKAQIAEDKAKAVENRAKELEEAKARLELGRANDNLDEIFLALKKLRSLGDSSAVSELEKVKSGIELLQNLRVAKGEHRHEDVVNDAAELIELFPKHAEARRDLKESGLIFNYLQTALQHLNSCFASDDKGELNFVMTVVKKKDDPAQAPSSEKSINAKEEFDLTRIAFNLKRATDSVDEAIKLDPQYDAALKLRKTVHQSQNTIGFLVSAGIFKIIDAGRPPLMKFFESVHSEMRESVGNRFDSPKDVWKRRQFSAAEFERVYEPLLKVLAEYASFLNQLDTKEIESVAKTAKEATVLLGNLKAVVLNPRGSLDDYKTDYLKVDEDFSKMIATWNTSSPNTEAIVSDVSGFAKSMAAFQLFKKPNTKKLLEKHKSLIISA